MKNRRNKNNKNKNNKNNKNKNNKNTLQKPVHLETKKAKTAGLYRLVIETFLVYSLILVLGFILGFITYKKTQSPKGLKRLSTKTNLNRAVDSQTQKKTVKKGPASFLKKFNLSDSKAFLEKFNLNLAKISRILDQKAYQGYPILTLDGVMPFESFLKLFNQSNLESTISDPVNRPYPFYTLNKRYTDNKNKIRPKDGATSCHLEIQLVGTPFFKPFKQELPNIYTKRSEYRPDLQILKVQVLLLILFHQQPRGLIYYAISVQAEENNHPFLDILLVYENIIELIELHQYSIFDYLVPVCFQKFQSPKDPKSKRSTLKLYRDLFSAAQSYKFYPTVKPMKQDNHLLTNLVGKNGLVLTFRAL